LIQVLLKPREDLRDLVGPAQVGHGVRDPLFAGERREAVGRVPATIPSPIRLSAKPAIAATASPRSPIRPPGTRRRPPGTLPTPFARSALPFTRSPAPPARSPEAPRLAATLRERPNVQAEAKAAVARDDAAPQPLRRAASRKKKAAKPGEPADPK